MADERPFVVFSDDWGRWPSSSQHLFSILGRRRRVLWVETAGLRVPRLDRRHARRVAEKIRSWTTPPSSPWTPMPRGMERLAVPVQPWFGNPAVAAVNAALIRRRVGAKLRALGWVDPVVVVTVPTAAEGIAGLPASAVAWYRVDDFSLWPGFAHESIRRGEQKLAELADALVTSAPPLEVPAFAGPRLLLEHGVDFEHFAIPPRPPLGSAPTLLFAGLVDERLDQELLADLPGKVVLAGRCTVPVRAGLEVLDPVPYAELPRTLASAAVLLLPYVRSRQTDTIQPLKLREYLASGRPVAATALPEVVRVAGDLVEIGDGAVGFSAAVRRALRDDSAGEDRRAAARGASWARRAEQLEEFLAGL